MADLDDTQFTIAEQARRDKADSLLSEYSSALVRAQTTRSPSDWVDVMHSFDDFHHALMACESYRQFSPAVPVNF